MARTFDNIALALDVVAGPSTRDPYSVAVDGSFVEAVRQPSLAGLRVGWSAGLGYGATDPAILAACDRSLRAMEGAGAIVEGITAGPLDSNPSLDWVTLIAPETARRALAVSDDLTRFDDAVRFTIEFGLGVTSTTYWRRPRAIGEACSPRLPMCTTATTSSPRQPWRDSLRS